MENNIFESVVLEPVTKVDASTVIALHLVILVVPVVDNDTQGSGLNR